jgi:hypothetical protein
MKPSDPVTPLPRGARKGSGKRATSDDDEEGVDLLPLKPLKLEAIVLPAQQKTGEVTSNGKRPAEVGETKAPAAVSRASKSPRLT